MRRVAADDVLGEVKRRYAAGQTIGIVAFALGLGPTTVRRMLQSSGVKLRKRKRWIDAGAYSRRPQ